MPRTPLTGSLLLAAALMLSGCFYSREIVRVKQDFEAQYPDAEFDRTVIVRAGPGAFRTMGWLARLAPDDEVDEIGSYLHAIETVKVGVYQVHDLPPEAATDVPDLPRFRDAGWEVAVKAAEDDGVTWLLYRETGETVRDLFLVVLEDEELVVVRLEGHLEALLERALRFAANRRRFNALADEARLFHTDW